MNFLVFLTVFSFFPAADSEGPPATSLPDPEHQLYSKRMLGWKICLEFVHLYSCVGWITAKLENVNRGSEQRTQRSPPVGVQKEQAGSFPMILLSLHEPGKDRWRSWSVLWGCILQAFLNISTSTGPQNKTFSVKEKTFIFTGITDISAVENRQTGIKCPNLCKKKSYF